MSVAFIALDARYGLLVAGYGLRVARCWVLEKMAQGSWSKIRHYPY